MKTLTIEWKHLDVEGETCDRCYDTGENLANEVKRLNRSLQPQDIEVVLVDTKLDETMVQQSNSLLFNGIPIEDILEIKVAENFCSSCTDLIGKETYCRTVEFEGNEYEDVPAKAIRQAALRVLGMDDAKKEEKKSTGCGCNCNGCC
ncbi:MAG: hypothetical protein CVU86_06340 [Firmicutes bacterium HGW-Firmicutes-11]|jgi:hypothetical protein|nr:MAG: hypothetical protein CVU86_06340 [Firmicutes bacterium HGW-Firmicutes-11]